MQNPVELDPARLGSVVQRLMQSPSEAVRFAVQAELNHEAILQQREAFGARVAELEKALAPDTAREQAATNAG